MKLGNASDFANAMFKTNTGKTINQQKIEIKQQKVDLSKDQISEMNHALGLNYKKKPSQNYFYCDGNRPSWSDLVDKGFAVRNAGWTEGKAYFRLTFEGMKLVFSKPISQKYFSKLS